MKKSKIGSYEFEIERARGKLKEMEAEKVLLQLPDGLRWKADKFIEPFEEEVTLWGGSCYGACDLPRDIGNSDALVHVGHSEIPNLKVDYPIIYLPGKSVEFKELPDELFEDLGERVGLYAPIQHVHQLEEVKERLSEEDHKTIIGEGDERIKHPGQVLGCNYSVKVQDADDHLYIGTGKFHPLGLSFSLKEDVFTYNPSTGQVDKIGEKGRDDFLKKRYGSISQLKECSEVAVITSTKKGQKRDELTEELIEIGEKEDIEMILVEFDEINPASVRNFGWDCLVSTACPRIALDDSDSFKATILTPDEFKIALNEKKWGNWRMDEIH